ncbi:MAG: hypothetical protein CMH55_01565 [Myxococcales bacterium]|nr:hypothetical protein [Myxococcales bacterium]|tara:strand:+ start:3411 stop:4112 length:702 start_codon:yes stop_codon:yes gene_type:complete
MAKKKKKVIYADHEVNGFTVMFTALSMIVLAFFIVLNALATINNLKVKKALASLYGSFGPLSGGKNIEPEKVLRVHEKAAIKQQKANQNYRSFLSRQQLDPGIEFLERDDSFTVALRDDLLFRAGITKVNPRMFKELNKIGRIIAEIGQPVTIAGYSDPSTPGRGVSNQELSIRRALLVRNYLVNAAGVDPTKLFVEGRGVEMSPSLAADPTFDPKVHFHRRRRVELIWGNTD